MRTHSLQESAVDTSDTPKVTNTGAHVKGSPPKGGLLQAISSIDAMLVLATVFGCGICQGVLDNCLFIRVQDIGGTQFLCGIGRSFMCWSEIPFFWLSGRLQRKYSLKKLLVLVCLTYVVRMGWYATMTRPWMMLLSEWTNGITWGVLWPVVMTLGRQMTPPHLQTTMMGCLNGLYWGVGCSLGSVIGGLMYARYGSALTFSCMSAFMVFPACMLSMSLTKGPNFDFASTQEVAIEAN